MGENLVIRGTTHVIPTKGETGYATRVNAAYQGMSSALSYDFDRLNEFHISGKTSTYGLLGDGTTDQGTAFGTFMAATTSSANVSYLPPGTYAYTPASNGLMRWANGSHLRGAGPYLSKVKLLATGWGIQSSISFPRRNLIIEGIGFDANQLATGCATILGSHVDSVIFRNCVFWHKNSNGLNFSGVRDALVDNCTFYGGGLGNSAQSAIGISAGFNAITIRNCRFIACSNGIVVDADTGTNPTSLEKLGDGLRIENCYSDGLWYLWPSQMSNSGGTVTYTSNTSATPPTGVLTDSAANFSTGSFWDQFDTPIRLLPTVRTGTLSATVSLGASLTDASATYVSKGVVRGDLLRTTGKFALVNNVVSETLLYHSGWFDSTTYEPTTTPTSGSYTLHRVILAKYNTKTSTTVTTYTGWYDCDGNLASINGGGNWVINGIDIGVAATGTLYEIATWPNYAFCHIENSTVHTQVTGNRVYRGYGDAISVWGGNHTSVTQNTVSDCQDVSITLNGVPSSTGGGHAVVANNVVDHPGAIGIYVGSAEDAVITGNVVSRPVWGNFINTFNVGCLLVQGFPQPAKRLLISNNKLDCGGRATARAGICLFGSTGAVVDAVLQGNDISGAQFGGIVLDGSSVTGTKLRDNTFRYPSAFSGYIAAAGIVRTGGTTNTVTWTAHGLTTGQHVKITITDGNFASGIFEVASTPTANTFTYAEAGSNVPSAAAAGISLYRRVKAAGLSRTASTVTVTLTAHGLTAGQYFALSSADADFTPGVYLVLPSPGANSFTYTNAGSAVSSGVATQIAYWQSIAYRNGAVGVDGGILRSSDFDNLAGSPEGIVTAGIGTQYFTDAGLIFMKQSGVSNTGWFAVT